MDIPRLYIGIREPHIGRYRHIGAKVLVPYPYVNKPTPTLLSIISLFRSTISTLRQIPMVVLLLTTPMYLLEAIVIDYSLCPEKNREKRRPDCPLENREFEMY